MAGNGASTLLGMADIVKRFPGVVALAGVDLDVRPGEVHCLLGQNGAGKSTLIKVLAGVHEPDEGTITWDGEEVHLGHPQAAMDLGIATIYQELDLVGGLTVAENIYLGHEMSRFGFSQRRAAANSTSSTTSAMLSAFRIALGARGVHFDAASFAVMSSPRDARTTGTSGPSRENQDTASARAARLLRMAFATHACSLRDGRMSTTAYAPTHVAARSPRSTDRPRPHREERRSTDTARSTSPHQTRSRIDERDAWIAMTAGRC